MQLASLLPAAALAWSATTNAFLLPPDVKGDALEAFKAIPDSNNHWTAHIDCAGCPVAQDKENGNQRGFVHAAELNSDLVLDFTTNPANEIVMGGVAVFPPRAVPDGEFTVKQVLKEGGDGMVSATEDNLRISSRMDFGKEQKLDEEGTVSVPFKMEILGVEDQVVHVDTVSFDILRDTTGHVYISNPQTIASPISPLDASCTSIFCRVKAQLLAKVAAAKAKVGGFANSCMRKMGFKPHHGGHRPSHSIADKLEEAKKTMAEAQAKAHETAESIKNKLHGGPDKFRGKFGKKPCPGKMGKHGHGHPHGKVGHMVMAFHRFAQHVLLPIMVGVAAGMAVSALGMVIGQIVFMIYMRIKGRRQGMVAVYHIVENTDAEAALEDEEPLPKYVEKEGLPAYTDEKTEI